MESGMVLTYCVAAEDLELVINVCLWGVGGVNMPGLMFKVRGRLAGVSSLLPPVGPGTQLGSLGLMASTFTC